MKSLSTLVLILTIITLSSCDETPKYIEGETKYESEITYIKDDRTGLCFAERLHLGTSCVPCTEEVLTLIEEYGRRVESDTIR